MSDVIADLVAALGLKIDEASFLRADKLLEGVKKGVAAIAGFLAIREIKGWIDDTVEAGDHAVKLSQKLGISIESVQELGYAAGQSGSGLEELAGGMTKLSKGLVDNIAAGKGPVLDAFHSMGISGAELKAKLSGPGGLDDVLAVVADKFADMEEGPKKTALAMDLFGKSGAELIPFLNSGAEGIAELRKEANDLGVVIGGDTAKAMEAWGDDTDRVKAAWRGIKNELVTAALPVLQEAVTFLLGAMKDAIAWVREHRTEIQAFFYAIGQVVRFVANVVTGAIEGIILVAESIGDILAFVGGIIKSTIESLITAFKWLMALPGRIWSGIKFIAGQVRDAFASLGNAIRDSMESAINFVADLLVVRTILNAVKELRALRSDKATDAYENAFAAGLTTESREEYEARTKINTVLNYGPNSGYKPPPPAMSPGPVTTPTPSAVPITGTGTNQYYNGAPYIPMTVQPAPTVTNTVSVQAPITITAPPGTTPEDLKTVITDHVFDVTRDALIMADDR